MDNTSIGMPWGFEPIKVHTDRYMVKSLHIHHGEGTSVQFHQRKDESVSLIAEDAKLSLYKSKDDAPSQSELSFGKWLRIRAGRFHRMESASGCEIMEVSAPEPDDMVWLIDPPLRQVTCLAH